MKPITILNDHDYFAEITRHIAATQPGDRVALMTMSFSPGEPLTAPLLVELEQAAKRGVQVQLNVDAMSFMVDDAHTLPVGPILWHGGPGKSRRADFRAKYEALERLQANGGNYCITNTPPSRITNPFAGRSHIKFTVVNDTAYLGGCNLSSTWQLDLMLRIDDANTADWMHDFILQAAHARHVLAALDGKDFTHSVDDATTILVDAGNKRGSIIYDQALQVIDEAKDWIVLTCQYFPGGRTAEHLLAAYKRGVKVTIYFGNSANHGALTLPHRLAERRERLKYPPGFFAHGLPKNLTRLHAKLLATETCAMIGSHNYVTQGVNFGTAESTLLRRDPKFARLAVDTFKARLAEAEHVNTR